MNVIMLEITSIPAFDFFFSLFFTITVILAIPIAILHLFSRA